MGHGVVVVIVDSAENLEKILQIRSGLPELVGIVYFGTEEIQNTDGVFSIGSSGPPKPVMLSHDNVIWTARLIGKYQSIATSGGAHLSFLPLSQPSGSLTDIIIPLVYATTVYFVPRKLVKETIFGKYKSFSKSGGAHISFHPLSQPIGMLVDIFIPLVYATTVYFVPRKFIKTQLIEILSEVRPTFLATVPFFFERIADQVKLSFETSAFKKMVFNKSWNIGRKAYRNSCGVEMDGCRTRFVPVEKTSYTELRVKGRNVFMGYLNEPQMTANAFDEDGWHRTGDLGYRDESGFIWIVGSLYELYTLTDGRIVAPIVIEEDIKNLLPFMGHCFAYGRNRPYLVMVFTFEAAIDEVTEVPLDVLSTKAEVFLRNLNVDVSAISNMVEHPPENLVSVIQSAIDKVNAASIRKWKFLPRDFSVPTGELNSLPVRNRFGSCGVEMDGCHTRFVPIGQTVYNESAVLMEMTFQNDYPMTPPFVRVVCPRFKFLPGHVTIGGGMRSGWSPSNDKQDTDGIVTCIDETRHGHETGKYVTFKEVQGMKELNGREPRPVKVLGPCTFSIFDTSQSSDYGQGVVATSVTMLKTMNFTSHLLKEDGTCEGDEIPAPHKKVGFIGISNWALDPAKMNRGILVQKVVPDEQELEQSAKGTCAKDRIIARQIDVLVQPMTKAYLELYESALMIREFFGLRDFYSLIKMVYGSMKRSGEFPTWAELQHAILRNFGGLDEIHPIDVYENHLKNVDKNQPSRATDPVCDSASLIRCSLTGDELDSESRYLLILTENYAALGLLQHELLKIKDAIIIFGSSFPKDQEYTQVCRKDCMETGRTMVLLNLKNLYDSLYDPLNQYYVRFGEQRFVDLGLGTQRVKCRIRQLFRLIVVAEKQLVYEKFPIPLINRLEKHFHAMSTMLTAEQMEVADRLSKCATDFTSVHGIAPRSMKQPKPANVFIGCHPDTAASLVLQVRHSGTNTDQKTKLTSQQILDEAKDLLLRCAVPDAILRLNNTRLAASANEICKKFFEEQCHSNLEDFLKRIPDEECPMKSLFLQVTTHSRLLLPRDASHMARVLQLKKADVALEALHAFGTEQQFCRMLREFFTEGQGTGRRVLLLQCDSGDVHAELIACARYNTWNEFCQLLVDDGAVERQLLHVIFICQLSRIAGGCFVGFQGGKWMSCHIDDLQPHDERMSSLMALKGRTLGTLFAAATAEKSTSDEPMEEGKQEEKEKKEEVPENVDDDPMLNDTEEEEPTDIDRVQMEAGRQGIDDGFELLANMQWTKAPEVVSLVKEKLVASEAALDVDGTIRSCLPGAAAMLKDAAKEKALKLRKTHRLQLLMELLSEFHAADRFSVPILSPDLNCNNSNPRNFSANKEPLGPATGKRSCPSETDEGEPFCKRAKRYCNAFVNTTIDTLGSFLTYLLPSQNLINRQDSITTSRVHPINWVCKGCSKENPSTLSSCRNCKEIRTMNDIPPPTNWVIVEPDDPSTVKSVPLKKGDEVYDFSKRLLTGQTTTTLSGIQMPIVTEDFDATRIVSLRQQQNLKQFQSYVVQRETIARDMLPGMPDEIYLLHGCSSSAARGILKNGFDKAFIGHNVGAVLGDGIYFSSAASYSLSRQFAQPDHLGHQTVLLCRVAIGRFTTGSKGLMEPPFLNGRSGRRFDSVVDNVERPVVYCIFDVSHIYVEGCIKVHIN